MTAQNLRERGGAKEPCADMNLNTLILPLRRRIRSDSAQRLVTFSICSRNRRRNVSTAVSVELPVSVLLQPAASGCFDCVVACAPTPLNMTKGDFAVVPLDFWPG